MDLSQGQIDAMVSSHNRALTYIWNTQVAVGGMCNQKVLCTSCFITECTFHSMFECMWCMKIACTDCKVKGPCAKSDDTCLDAFCSQECLDDSDSVPRYTLDGKLLDCTSCQEWEELTRKKQKV